MKEIDTNLYGGTFCQHGESICDICNPETADPDERSDGDEDDEQPNDSLENDDFESHKEYEDPTRYRILTLKRNLNVLSKSQWFPFAFYSTANKRRMFIRDQRPEYEINIEYSWQD